jgi:hypothetical protein
MDWVAKDEGATDKLVFKIHRGVHRPDSGDGGVE